MFMVWLMYRTHMIQYVSVLYSTAQMIGKWNGRVTYSYLRVRGM